jgi:hypothetical protein
MKTYKAKEDADFVDSIITMLEQDTKKKVFTLRILEHTETGLETLIVFDDKEILTGIIKVVTVKGKMGIRVQGNFI